MRGLLAFSISALVAAAATAAGPSRVFRNDAQRVRAFEPPPAWQLAPQASYPRLLAGWVHPDGGRITLAAQKVAAGTGALAFAEAARAALTKQGFGDLKLAGDAERARVEGTLDGGRRLLRQLYVVDGGQAWVVTLVAPESRAQAMTRDFEAALRSLQILPSLERAPAAASADAGTPP